MTYVGADYNIIPLLSVGQFFCGLSGFTMMIQTYLYLFECCEEVFRQRATVAINYSWYERMDVGP